MVSSNADLLDFLLDNCNELNDLCYFLEVAMVEMLLVPMVQSVNSNYFL